MASVDMSGQNSAMASSTFSDAAATFDKMQDLLKAKDDTSRFVGLALLKTVLDNAQLGQDPAHLRTLWEAISPKFLDRLLKAQENDKVKKSEAKDMVDLAVSILHTFSNLLPEESRKEKRLTGRIAPLLKALLQSTPDTTKLILQTLTTIVSQTEGSLEMLVVEDLSPLVELASQDPLVLDILTFMWINGSTMNTKFSTVKDSINKIMPLLIVNFKNTDAVTFITFAGSLLPKLEPEALPQSPKWLDPVISILRKLIYSKPTAAGRAAYTQLAAALLQAYPATSPNVLFKDDTPDGSDSKPFSYLFVNLLLIDIRSSFPSLLSKLNSSEYPAISSRLASAFDVISSFIGFLVRSLDEEVNTTGFSMAPDLLLKLRKDIAETVSLTIEYLRDRWDASVAGASGLHPDAISGTSATSEGTRLTLTWESMKDNVSADPLILAGIRVIAIWIREDDNENLRNETAGLMDMLVALYKLSSQEGLDFRFPILLALEGIMITEVGVDGFLGQNGWEVVFNDLQSILKSTSDQQMVQSSFTSGEAGRGLQAIRVLLAVVDHDSTPFPHEDWMMAVKITSAIKVHSITPPLILEFQIGMLQLSTALLSKAAGGMTKRYITSYPALAGLVQQLKSLVHNMDDENEAAELDGLLEDVSLDLGNLRQG